MKYIDAEKLKAEIEKRMHICDGIFERDSDTYYQGKAVAYQETLSLIDSLQQEQLPGIEDQGIPGKDFIPVDWVDACEKYGKWKIVKVK